MTMPAAPPAPDLSHSLQQINGMADGIAADLCEKIATLRQLLDTMEQEILSSAVRAKHTLNAHVEACQQVHDEALRMRRVVADLRGETDVA